VIQLKVEKQRWGGSTYCVLGAEDGWGVEGLEKELEGLLSVSRGVDGGFRH